MKIYYTNVGFFKRHYITKVLEAALAHLSQPSEQLEVSVSFVGEDEIRELNKEYRNNDNVTDVLSFPAVENPDRGVINVEEHAADLNPETWGILSFVCRAPRRKPRSTDTV